MSNPGVYADLVKIPSDFLKKDYPETQQIEVTENVSGYPVSLINTLTRKQDGSVLFNFNPKINLGKQFQNGLLSVNVDTAKNAKGELTFNTLAPGLKAVLTVSVKGNKKSGGGGGSSGPLQGRLALHHNTSFFGGCCRMRSKLIIDPSSLLSSSSQVDSNSAQTELQYKKDAVALTAIIRSNKKFTASAVFGYQQFSLGLLANVNAQSQEVEGLEGTLLYRREGLLIGLSPKNKGQNLAITLFDRVNARLAIGADINVDMKKLDAVPKLTIGSQYFVDSKSFLKVKVDQDLRIGLGYTVPVNDTTKVQLGLSVNSKDLSVEGKHTFGFNVTLAL
ncbi:hypothetical protein SAMD00019534_058850 [Acytostelium subglobosum LB1]|uniref:hypothetical protein n=1 Tax=Acytostelium subglobosum LB1 TaxID=1410327 RepID=UPI000644CD1F|nr:hypothetical protein SAMD00019534_058850 [Acytostelium subglobosum LB1]GAM22710.1 hypothetical protein SAMD00019534_058850 [Acytostelium subglobosum LB1]|eukprot:XP_012753937.1 hypothetical protein SAMD00019534_058850 [Acytostelium subglobosum LB1]